MKSWLPISVILNILGLLGIGFLVWWMGGFSNLWARIANRGLSKEYHMLKDQYAKLPNEKAQVLLLGNSLTYYGEWSSWISDKTIANRGIPGDGIEGLQDRMSDYKEIRPEYVMVMIGINDLAFHPKEWLIERYPVFIEELIKEFSPAKIVVQSILPINNAVSNTGHDNSEINWVNDQLKALLKDKPIAFKDISSGFGDEHGSLRLDWTEDGIHLNGAAYAHWSELIKTWLAEDVSEN